MVHLLYYLCYIYYIYIHIFIYLDHIFCYLLMLCLCDTALEPWHSECPEELYSEDH